MNGGIEAIFKSYSVITDREDNWLPSAIMRAENQETSLDRVKLNHFLGRFSDEKPFGSIVLEAITKKKVKKDTIIHDTCISEDILEKILKNSSLPNTLPVKRMISLLKLLKIPLDRAAESIRVSLDRLSFDKSLGPVSSVTMRRRQTGPCIVEHRARSKESLKRDIEAYIKRLMREDT